MTTNRLAKSAVADDGPNVLTACEFAAIARETGQLEKAKLWDQRAAELGEERIPNGITVRYRKIGEKKFEKYRTEFRP